MESLNKQELVSKLYNSRSRVLIHSPFFSSILYKLHFCFSTSISDISTDGYEVYINPQYLKELSDAEVDVCLLHILMHIVLKHHLRKKKEYDQAIFNMAADMIVNSNILNLLYKDTKNELVVHGKKLPHLTPEKKEAYEYSLMELYDLLIKTYPNEIKQKTSKSSKSKGYSIDSYVSKATPKMEKVIGKIKSITGGLKHLRDASLISYQSDGSYAFFYDDFDDSDYSSIQFELASFLPNGDQDEIIVKIKDRDVFPVYTYLELPSNTYRTKDMTLDEASINSLISTKKNKNIIKQYRDEVYKQYLAITKEQSDYFSNLEGSIKLQNKDIASKIIFIRNYIASSAIYNCEVESYPFGKDYVVYFLDGIKEGDCKHFANAALSMFRYYNIPARIVGGLFLEANEEKETTVYEENGHVWLEVFIDDVGWIMVDPTPLIAYRGGGGSGTTDDNPEGIDSHTKWRESSTDSFEEDELDQLISQGNEISKMAGKQPPAGIRKILDELTNPDLNWRELLNTYIQEEINDYTFTPPDRRFSDGDFLLPDFNDHDYKPEKVIIMMDVSGSINEKEITDFINEVKGAINLYDNKLLGYVGFFDTRVRLYIPIEEFNDDTLAKIPGGGGTDFYSFFYFIKDKEDADDYKKVFVFTDGYATYPPEDYLPDKEVIWVINNKDITPPWGKVIRYNKDN